jgi:DNA polymerase elongation subunit (family B)
MSKVTFHDLVSKLKELALELEKTPTLREFCSRGNSKRQIDKYKYSEIVKAAGLEPNKHAQTTPPVEVVIRNPKILAFDLELAPIVAQVWGLYDQNVGLNQIQSDWYILSYAAKFLDEEPIHYLDQRYSNPIEDDRQLCEGIHHLISQADVLLTHNGDKFDIKKLNARFIKHGLDPIAPKQSIDTLKIARRIFSFTSNKLEYIAKFLGCSEKLKHTKFAGHSMWSECLKGNAESFMEMERYNKQDVETLIEIYEKLVKFDPSISFAAYSQKRVCSCKSETFFKDGLRYTKQGAFQVFRCSACHKCFTAKENLIDKDIRKGLFK